MVSPHANPHAHEHEWRVPHGDDAFLYEDGAMHIAEECQYVEQKPVGHSERHDETFYETMYRCDKARSHRFDLTKIEIAVPENVLSGRGYETVAAGADVFEMEEDVPYSLIEEIELAAIETLSEGTEDSEPQAIEWFDYRGVDTADHTVEVDVDEKTLRLTYGHTDTITL